MSSCKPTSLHEEAILPQPCVHRMWCRRSESQSIQSEPSGKALENDKPRVYQRLLSVLSQRDQESKCYCSHSLQRQGRGWSMQTTIKTITNHHQERNRWWTREVFHLSWCMWPIWMPISEVGMWSWVSWRLFGTLDSKGEDLSNVSRRDSHPSCKWW